MGLLKGKVALESQKPRGLEWTAQCFLIMVTDILRVKLMSESLSQRKKKRFTFIKMFSINLFLFRGERIQPSIIPKSEGYIFYLEKEAGR